MAAKSPNYPVVDLGSALADIANVLEKENRNRMSRAVLAKHLGYNSLNGRALGRIAAVRAYGLVEGGGEELRVSGDAVDAIKSPAGSDARKAALERLATKPPLFKDLRAAFPDTLPSEANIEYWLAKRNFTGKGAGKAAKSYLSTMRLVSTSPEGYFPSELEQEDEDMTAAAETPDAGRRQPSSPPPPSKDELSVLLKGNRLHINANVDLEGLERLKQMLDKYTEILKLMQ